MKPEKTTLIYFGDPMCSWCYGFAPELKQAVKEFKNQINFKLVMGGLRPYNTQTIDQLSDFLKHHWEQVAETSGQVFNYNLLQDSSFVYDTEPPARAVVTLRHLQPALEYDFYELIQTSFYAKNLNTNKLESYLDLVGMLNISGDDFQEMFESDEMKQAVKEDFRYSSQVGVRGFPTLVLSTENKLQLISNGYTKGNLLIERINSYLSGT